MLEGGGLTPTIDEAGGMETPLAPPGNAVGAVERLVQEDQHTDGGVDPGRRRAVQGGTEVQHERDRDNNAHQAGERNDVRREPGRVNGPGQRGPEFIEEEALEEG